MCGVNATSIALHDVFFWNSSKAYSVPLCDHCKLYWMRTFKGELYIDMVYETEISVTDDVLTFVW